MPTPWVFVWIVVAAVAARTAAMAFNRYVDRDVDARNPRTAGRELPSGVLKPRSVLVLILASSAVFVGASFALNTLCGLLAFPVLGVLFFYSWVKRFSWTSHLVLGLCLGLAPLGAWLAVTGSFGGGLGVPLLLAASVLTWVAGFDLIYACQDRGFDAEHGLHSVPARFGVAGALKLSAALHGLTVLLFALFAWQAQLGWVFAVALALATCLLVWQHRIVSPSDLSRVNLAFFTLNGWVGVGLFLGTLLDLARAGEMT